MNGVPRVSICLLTRRRSPALERCLDSLAAQGDGVGFELLVASDGDPRIAGLVRERFPDAIVGLVRGAHPGHARNLLVAQASGELLWFLDDDVEVPPGTLARLVATADAHPLVAVFGGPNLTPAGSSRLERLQGAVLGSLIGAGPVRRRYRRHRTGPADDRSLILCNLAVRRGQMVAFPPELMGGEENALLEELRRRGVPMRYEAELAVSHARRPTLRAFLTQMYKYGRGRGQAMRRRPSTARPAYLAPVALDVALLTAAPLAAISAWALAPLALYAVLVVAQATAIGVRAGRPSYIACAAPVIVALHVVYGAGVVHGLARTPRRRAAEGTEAFESLAAPAT